MAPFSQLPVTGASDAAELVEASVFLPSFILLVMGSWPAVAVITAGVGDNTGWDGCGVIVTISVTAAWTVPGWLVAVGAEELMIC